MRNSRLAVFNSVSVARVVCSFAVLASVACSGNEDSGASDGPAAGGTSGGTPTTTGAGSSSTTATGGSTATGPTTSGETSTNGAPDTVTASTGTTTGSSGAGGNDATNGAGPDGVGGSTSGPTTTGGGGTGGADSVTRTEATYTFDHFPIEANADRVWSGATTPGTEPTSTTFDTVVLENGYLKVTLLPEYGGRILSIVHKPSGRELLYQNPLGTPYLMLEGIFYYDYLVILGGIFPSFPEPEHGKYWNQPYELEVVSESTEAITVRMSRQDDLDLTAGVPADYDAGRTDVRVQLDVTLRAGSSGLELATTLTNTKNSAVPEFEYWTVTTLAPGSTPGQTAISPNAHIVAKMDQVHLLEEKWPWFADAETRVADEVFTWNNLASFTNWDDQGTAFANPEYSANYSGLINPDNGIGVLRVSDNVETNGLKLWTFGKQSLDIDINDSSEWLRPAIEMWYGVTPEFWDRATLAPNEVRTWKDTYFPTFGLEQVTAASEHGALALSSSVSGTDTLLKVDATLTLPEQTVKVVLRLDGAVVLEQDVVVAAAEGTSVSATVPSADAATGAVFEAEFLQGAESLLSGQVALP